MAWYIISYRAPVMMTMKMEDFLFAERRNTITDIIMSTIIILLAPSATIS